MQNFGFLRDEKYRWSGRHKKANLTGRETDQTDERIHFAEGRFAWNNSKFIFNHLIIQNIAMSLRGMKIKNERKNISGIKLINSLFGGSGSIDCLIDYI